MFALVLGMLTAVPWAQLKFKRTLRQPGDEHSAFALRSSSGAAPTLNSCMFFNNNEGTSKELQQLAHGSCQLYYFWPAPPPPPPTTLAGPFSPTTSSADVG